MNDRILIPCAHGAGWPSPLAAEECDCIPTTAPLAPIT